MLQRITSGQELMIAITAALLLGATGHAVESEEFEKRTAKQWYRFVEWRIDDVMVSDAINPFDVVAWVAFEHGESGDTIRSGMYYDGAGTWKFRFTGTRVGRWNFETSSDDAADLDGLGDTVAQDLS